MSFDPTLLSPVKTEATNIIFKFSNHKSNKAGFNFKWYNLRLVWFEKESEKKENEKREYVKWDNF